MASDPRRQRLVLGGLLVVLALVVWWQFAPAGGSAPAGPTTPTTQQRTAARPAATPDETIAAGVALDRLASVPPSPIDSGRDPFVRGMRRAATSGPGATGNGGFTPGSQAPVTSAPVMPVQTGPPPPPPITVKFIGVVERDDVGTVAVLSDGRNVYYGREGEIVDGRWRIVSIGVESLQIEYADGRGRQTVRLTG